MEQHNPEAARPRPAVDWPAVARVALAFFMALAGLAAIAVGLGFIYRPAVGIVVAGGLVWFDFQLTGALRMYGRLILHARSGGNAE